MKKILFIDNTAHHLFGQLHLMNAFKVCGYSVEIISPDDGNYYRKISDLGFVCHHIDIDGKRVNPLADLILINKFKLYFQKIRPSLICSFTIKPNLYASIAARSLNIPVIAGVTGLGTAFMKKNLLNYLVVKLYKFAFRDIGCVFFQNSDDQCIFNNLAITQSARFSISLPGDGVALDRFPYVGLKPKDNLTFLYSGRLLGDKGLHELIAAFNKVKTTYPNVCLIIIGNYFLGNPTAISESTVNEWTKDNSIRYLGMINNVSEIIADCDCVVLPSYREGMPRSLLEASSMGKPIITVNSIGCQDVVDTGVTGYMAKVRDIDSLAEAMLKFIELPFDKKVEMGLQGRRKMEREFDQRIVVNKYLDIASRLINKNSN